MESFGKILKKLYSPFKSPASRKILQLYRFALIPSTPVGSTQNLCLGLDLCGLLLVTSLRYFQRCKCIYLATVSGDFLPHVFFVSLKFDPANIYEYSRTYRSQLSKVNCYTNEICIYLSKFICTNQASNQVCITTNKQTN